MFARQHVGVTALWLALVVVAAAQANPEPPAMTVLAPVPFQVVQRDPASVKGKAGTPGHRPGTGKVRLVWRDAARAGGGIEWRVTTVDGTRGRDTAWAAAKSQPSGDAQAAEIEAPAGGWYRLELRRPQSERPAATVEPFGVGEVFVVAGQSYADGWNDELMKVEDEAKRVAAHDLLKKAWRVADDPQPNIARHGTIWPPMADLLLPKLEVPIGLVNVARAGTSSSRWMPGGELHKRLLEAGGAQGRFRAVLWQQGESDVIGNVAQEKYVANLKAIRAAAVEAWGFEPVWLLAKSTHHPTVYNKPKEEEVIRSAIEQLSKMPGFAPGPDTDTLRGENRGGPGSKRHFSAVGQRRAAALWAERVLELIR